MEEKIIVELYRKNGKALFDMETPLNITAIELIRALNEAMHLGIKTDIPEDCYLTAENPIALLRGNSKLSEYGLHDGSRIYI
jgi:uncharacterized ubiquitin-like protein YukD